MKLKETQYRINISIEEEIKFISPEQIRHRCVIKLFYLFFYSFKTCLLSLCMLHTVTIRDVNINLARLFPTMSSYNVIDNEAYFLGMMNCKYRTHP